MSEEEQAPQAQDEVKSEDPNATINIKVCPSGYQSLLGDREDTLTRYRQVVSSTGDEVFFKIKRSTKLSKLQGAYASKVGKDVGSIRYVQFNVDPF